VFSHTLCFRINLGYRLHPETIPPHFADLSSTTHVQGRVPGHFTLSETIVFTLSAKGVRKGSGWG